jgi:hypothetical protein
MYECKKVTCVSKCSNVNMKIVVMDYKFKIDYFSPLGSLDSDTMIIYVLKRFETKIL